MVDMTVYMHISVYIDINISVRVAPLCPHKNQLFGRCVLRQERRDRISCG